MRISLSVGGGARFVDRIRVYNNVERVWKMQKSTLLSSQTLLGTCLSRTRKVRTRDDVSPGGSPNGNHTYSNQAPLAAWAKHKQTHELYNNILSKKNSNFFSCFAFHLPFYYLIPQFSFIHLFPPKAQLRSEVCHQLINRFFSLPPPPTHTTARTWACVFIARRLLQLFVPSSTRDRGIKVPRY